MKANVPSTELDVYSNGLAVIFLCEASSKKYAREIEFFLDRLKARQKQHGGWGYENAATGDTSQTQYGPCRIGKRIGMDSKSKPHRSISSPIG